MSTAEVPFRETRVYWRVRPAGFSACVFETREGAEAEADNLRAESSDEIRVSPVRMDPLAFARLPEFGGY